MLCPGTFIYVGCSLKWRQKLLSLNTTGIFLEPGGATVVERALHGPAYSENGASRQTREASLARNLRDDQEARLPGASAPVLGAKEPTLVAEKWVSRLVWQAAS